MSRNYYVRGYVVGGSRSKIESAMLRAVAEDKIPGSVDYVHVFAQHDGVAILLETTCATTELADVVKTIRDILLDVPKQRYGDVVGYVLDMVPREGFCERSWPHQASDT